MRKILILFDILICFLTLYSLNTIVSIVMVAINNNSILMDASVATASLMLVIITVILSLPLRRTAYAIVETIEEKIDKRKSSEKMEEN